MPSWTFVATPCAALSVGLSPYFCDVDIDTWMPDPEIIARRQDLDQFAAMIVVAPFGAPVDAAKWEWFRETTGIPVVIDAAAAFDTLPPNGPMAIGSIPVAISMHATKTFAVGEAGAVFCTDPEIVSTIRAILNFGFLGSRDARVLGFNGKLSESVAAVAHATLDEWPETRMRWIAAQRLYLDLVPRDLLELIWLPGHGNLALSTLNCVFPDSAMASTAENRLTDRGIGTRRWWGRGCHRQTALVDLPSDLLPVTENLAGRTLGLPIWCGMPERDVAEIVETVAVVVNGG